MGTVRRIACSPRNISLLQFRMTSVQQRLEEVRNRVHDTASGRHVRLVAVSKFQPKEAIAECYQVGHRSFGENYVQELEDKAAELKDSCPEIEWHFIGQLQSNKIPKLGAVPNLHCVETLESEKHCVALEKAIAKRGGSVRVLVQVNTSHEEQKGGLTPSEAIALSSFIRKDCPHLVFGGFMTIGSVENTGKVPNPDFDLLTATRKKLAEQEGLDETSIELSMGMSSDMETAIKQGSTSVRVGTSIFGARK